MAETVWTAMGDGQRADVLLSAASGLSRSRVAALMAEGRDCTLLDVHILTGRTHQIRVHMQAIHHPVCGDPIYGWEKGARVPCLMLHAFSLRFAHPRTGETLFFRAPLPEDFRKGLRQNGVEWPEEAEAEEIRL